MNSRRQQASEYLRGKLYRRKVRNGSEEGKKFAMCLLGIVLGSDENLGKLGT